MWASSPPGTTRRPTRPCARRRRRASARAWRSRWGRSGSTAERRVEIDRRHAERGEVIELLIDALEVAAHVVPATRPLLRRAPIGGRCIEPPRAVRRSVGVVPAVALGQRPPVELQNWVVVSEIPGVGIVVPAAVAEAFGEDLVDDGILR